MSSDAKPTSIPQSAAVTRREKGVRIYTYPKMIFIFPTFVMTVLCWIVMLFSGDHTIRPSHAAAAAATAAAPAASATKGAAKQAVPVAEAAPHSMRERTKDFLSTPNVLGLLFAITFAFNLLFLTFDFPRFTIVAISFLVTTALFFLLWLGTITNILTPLVYLFEGVYIAANSGFYLVLALILLVMYGLIFIARFLDYWEFMPNEILHHHGPWSDLERFPTMNLKFDKEIPDIFEHALFGAGRLVFHLPNEQKAIILDNVLQINKAEEALKQIMSRMEVRVTTDQEAAQPLP